MFQNLTSTNNISFILVFIEGLLSFLSPCVVPLIPIYMGYLAGNARQTGEDGVITYQRKKVFFHTVFFVLGISTSFFILGLSFTALGSFFWEHKLLFARIGGILILLLGLIQIGFLDFKFLQRERRLPFRFRNTSVNPAAAYLMGFTFSFAWTPCVGPALSSVLIMASGAKSSLTGNLLVFIYSAGFIIPFLLLGLFTTQVLNFLKGHQKLLKYTVKAGGALLILIGIMTFTGWMNGITKYLSSFNPPAGFRNEDIVNPNAEEDTSPKEGSSSEDTTDGGSKADSDGNNAGGTAEPEADDKVAAFDFTLTDQYGNTHTLSDYKGKVVFLNFWASWCSPCRREMPDIEELYREYGENEEEVVILGVANPSSKEYPNNQDEQQEEIISFLEDSAFTFPTVFDVTGEVFQQYYISSFPTTFVIDKDGNFYGYAAGMLTKDIMVNSIEQALELSN